MNKQLRQGALALVIIMATTASARAQGYISPMLGFNFPDVIIQGVALPSEKLNNSRISAGVAIQF